MSESLEIAGAGPAGLSAAIHFARSGGKAIVYERHAEVGQRFHGDFQGLENWTTRGDVLEELASLGIEANWERKAFRECVFWGPNGEPFEYRSTQPIWYLVRRGSSEGTLDRSLKEQALAAGVDLRLGSAQEHLPQGGVVAHGPHRADVIAVGYTFDTDRADAAFAALSDDLAPKGYAYLLIWKGRGTLASCFFEDFHNEKTYLERTAAFFQNQTGIRMSNPRRFGGFGNVFSEARARKGNLLYVGEAAGFQDALFGFGMRYAMVSGSLAAQAWRDGKPQRYDTLWPDRFGTLFSLAATNRFLFERLGNRGYVRLLRRIGKTRDVRDWLREFYAEGWIKKTLAPYARRKWKQRRQLIGNCIDGCDCTWCRCDHARERKGAPVAAIS